MSENLLVLRVIKAHTLEENLLVQQCERRSVRNWGMQLEYGQGSRLCQYLRGVIPLLPVDVVHTRIRILAPYAALVANGVCNHFCLPASTASGTWCVPRVGWKWLAPIEFPPCRPAPASLANARLRTQLAALESLGSMCGPHTTL